MRATWATRAGSLTPGRRLAWRGWLSAVRGSRRAGPRRKTGPPGPRIGGPGRARRCWWVASAGLGLVWLVRGGSRVVWTRAGSLTLALLLVSPSGRSGRRRPGRVSTVYTCKQLCSCRSIQETDQDAAKGLACLKILTETGRVAVYRFSSFPTLGLSESQLMSSTTPGQKDGICSVLLPVISASVDTCLAMLPQGWRKCRTSEVER